ncbi:hypothetical protein Hanom_Chr11g01055331 [Helianthus anomalus]
MVCRSMLPSGDVYSQKIELGQHGIHVFVACQHGPPQKEHSFVCWPSGMFKVLHIARSCGRLWKGRKPGTRNLFDMFCSSYIVEEGVYLCGGTLT